jgi:hypothetical protein
LIVDKYQIFITADHMVLVSAQHVGVHPGTQVLECFDDKNAIVASFGSWLYWVKGE